MFTYETLQFIHVKSNLKLRFGIESGLFRHLPSHWAQPRFTARNQSWWECVKRSSGGSVEKTGYKFHFRTFPSKAVKMHKCLMPWTVIFAHNILTGEKVRWYDSTFIFKSHVFLCMYILGGIYVDRHMATFIHESRGREVQKFKSQSWLFQWNYE